jgi:prepilin-type N-terminal cleavage/methylation domain-containing protein
MLTRIRKRMKGQKGFTLIELLVVIIIIAILAAIAIPTFLGQRQKAQDAAAKSLVRNAMTAYESAYVDARTYAPGTVTDVVLHAIEPSIVFVLGTDATVVPTGTIAIGATALASANSVDYFGTATAFEIGSVSASDNKFGVYSDKSAAGAGTVFVKLLGTTASTGW